MGILFPHSHGTECNDLYADVSVLQIWRQKIAHLAHTLFRIVKIRDDHRTYLVKLSGFCKIIRILKHHFIGDPCHPLMLCCLKRFDVQHHTVGNLHKLRILFERDHAITVDQGSKTIFFRKLKQLC